MTRWPCESRNKSMGTLANTETIAASLSWRGSDRPGRAKGIFFITHSAGRTGAPIGLLAFMRWLHVNTSYRVGTVLGSPGPLEASFRELGPTLTLGTSVLTRSRFGRRLSRWLPREIREETRHIRRLFSEGTYDLIYSNTMTNGVVLAALAPFQVPVITHAHELEYWIRRAGPENLRQVLARTTAFVAASQAVRNHLVRAHRVPAEKITVVHEHIRDLPPLPSAEEKLAARQALAIPDQAFVVGCCGAEHWRKGRDLIPQFLVALRRKQPWGEFHFLWVGRPGTNEEEAALQYDLRQAGVQTRFHSTGEAVNPFVYYPAMDVFALLSRDDPYPLACLEVAAMGKPIVCFANAGGMPEFVQGGGGFAAPYLDVDAMASAVIRLATDVGLAKDCGEHARAKVARENTLETTAPRLQAVIETLAGSPT